MERHRPHIVTSFTRPRLSLSHLCTFSSRLDHALTPAVIGPLARLLTTGQQAASKPLAVDAISASLVYRDVHIS